jgi:excisionase family DNA binding protein
MSILNERPAEEFLAYSVEEAAKRASVGRTIIYSAIKMGYLKARKVGRRTVVLDGDLRDWLASLPARNIAA